MRKMTCVSHFVKTLLRRCAQVAHLPTLGTRLRILLQEFHGLDRVRITHVTFTEHLRKRANVVSAGFAYANGSCGSETHKT